LLWERQALTVQMLSALFGFSVFLLSRCKYTLFLIENNAFAPLFCRFLSFISSLSGNESIGIVQQIHRFRSTIPLVLFNDSNGIAKKDWQFSFIYLPNKVR